MSTQDTEERREYYRIKDSIALQIISRGEAPAAEGAEAPGTLFSLLSELHQLDFEARHLLRQVAEGNRPLANYLNVQNKRIELLGQALARSLLTDIGTPQPVTLSEGGLSFIHERAFAPNAPVLLKMVLMPQAMGLLLPARVLDCRQDAQGGFAISTAFEALTDAQRQLLARHILQKQAQVRRLSLEHAQGS